MRIAFAMLLLAAAAPFDTAKADPYRWCADYGGGGHGSRPQLLFHHAGAMPLGHLRQRRRLRAQSIL